MPSITRISTDILILNKGKTKYLGKEISKGIDKYSAQFPAEKMIRIGEENILLNSINIVSRTSNHNVINYLDDLAVNIEFTQLKEKCADVLCLEIFDNEASFIAECFIDIPKKYLLSNKINAIKAVIPNIQLCSGKYYITLIFCKKINDKPNGKFISQFRSVLAFNVNNSAIISHAPFLLKGKIV